jgi:hypothetical protein
LIVCLSVLLKKFNYIYTEIQTPYCMFNETLPKRVLLKKHCAIIFKIEQFIEDCRCLCIGYWLQKAINIHKICTIINFPLQKFRSKAPQWFVRRKLSIFSLLCVVNVGTSVADWPPFYISPTGCVGLFVWCRNWTRRASRRVLVLVCRATEKKRIFISNFVRNCLYYMK